MKVKFGRRPGLAGCESPALSHALEVSRRNRDRAVLRIGRRAPQCKSAKAVGHRLTSHTQDITRAMVRSAYGSSQQA